MTPTPRLFISYSHDSAAHREFVLALANRLRGDGLDCQIDQYVNGFPAEGWQRWMENRIEQADFVLVVCTPLYLRRYRGQEPEGGRGVNFEGVVISQTLYDAYYRNTKFIPLLPESGKPNDVPLPLKQYTTLVVPKDYEQLYRLLTGQHATPPPEIGGKRLMEQEAAAKWILSKENQGSRTAQTKTAPHINLKSVWIGAGVILLVALIAILFTVFGSSDIHTQGNCSSIITGDINGSLSQNCTQEKQ